LDLRQFKNIVQQESARLRLRSFSTDGESSFTLTLALSSAVKKIFFDKSEMTFSSEPRLDKELVTQFANKMRVDAMEKFNSTTVFAVIQFAANQEDLKRQEYMVTLVVYLEQKFLPEFLRMLQYPYIEFDNDEEVKDGCGTLVNLIGGQFKREMSNLGYKDLMMSHFESFINTAADGVGIPKGVTEKFELNFEIDGVKRLVIEMVTLDMLPKWKTRERSAAKKILVIDDDPTFIKTIEPFLLSQGFDVMVAYDGEQGLKKLAWKPQLIVLDLQMPVMDGYEFVLAKKNVEGAQEIPVIVLTARPGMSELLKIAGAREYLLKPFQPASLLKSIQRCI